MTWPTKTDFVDGDVLTASQVNNIGTNLNLFDPTSATSGQVPVADGAGSVAWGGVASGFTPITPTSINYTGTSATIGASGAVSYSAISSLSLNGVFSATYDNYLIVIGPYTDSGSDALRMRLRVAGADNSTASSYNSQFLIARYNGATSVVEGDNLISTNWLIAGTNTTMSQTNYCYVSKPFSATATTMRTVTQQVDATSPRIRDNSATHNQTTSYDGFTMYVGSSLTGTVIVLGIKK